MDRRAFLKATGAGAVASVVGAAWAQENPPRIQRYRLLGRTGIEMSDISLGSYGGLSPRIIERAFALGVTYFDTAPDYRGNGLVSEESIGKVFRASSKRQQVAIATKMCAARNYPAHWPRGTQAEQITRGVEESLKRLQTDRIDVLLLHGVGELEEGDQERVKDAEALEAFRRLKEAGKARFLGMGCHGPRDMVKTVEWAIDSGHYDVVQVAYNFFNGTSFNFRHHGLDRVLQKAHDQGVGVIAMKTRAGASEEDVARLTADGANFSHACFNWVMANPHVAGLLVTVRNVQEVEEYVAGSGQSMGMEDERLLREYAALFGRGSCRIGCGACLDHCPQGVAIPTVLRYQMYHDAYHAPQSARQAYAALPQSMRPLGCAECAAPCLAGCPHGVDIKGMLTRARASLEGRARA
jgi:predicted aldo/keto reductase-like oxidoreductase